MRAIVLLVPSSSFAGTVPNLRPASTKHLPFGFDHRLLLPWTVGCNRTRHMWSYWWWRCAISGNANQLVDRCNKRTRRCDDGAGGLTSSLAAAVSIYCMWGLIWLRCARIGFGSILSSYIWYISGTDCTTHCAAPWNGSNDWRNKNQGDNK